MSFQSIELKKNNNLAEVEADNNLDKDQIDLAHSRQIREEVVT